MYASSLHGADMSVMDPSRLDSQRKTLEAASRDFGRTVRKQPLAVARPNSVSEVVEIIRHASRERIPLTVQGAGHSQSGQSLSDSGILLNTKRLNRIGDIEGDEIRVQSGVSWRELVHRVYAEGYLPPALTTHLSVTVGGTLSVAGLSTTSHTYGSQADNVTELEVVTGDGRRLRCSADSNSALFDCVRGGLGQFGAITEARLRLRKALPNVRSYGLLYEDVLVMMQDLELLSRDERFQYIDGWCMPVTRSLWQVLSGELFAHRVFAVYLSVEWDETPPNDEEMLSGLHHAFLANRSDYPTLEFVTHKETKSLHSKANSDRTKSMTRGEAGPRRLKWFDDWSQAHPCTEGVLPWDTFPQFMTDVASELPGPVARTARIMLGPFRGERFRAPLFMRPEGEMLMGYGILIEAPPSEMKEVLPILARESRRIIDAGGKRYLSGWLDFDRQDWQKHYGDLWARMLEWKREFDPRHILNPGGIPLSP